MSHLFVYYLHPNLRLKRLRFEYQKLCCKRTYRLLLYSTEWPLIVPTPSNGSGLFYPSHPSLGSGGCGPFTEGGSTRGRFQENDSCVRVRSPNLNSIAPVELGETNRRENPWRTRLNEWMGYIGVHENLASGGRV